MRAWQRPDQKEVKLIVSNMSGSSAMGVIASTLLSECRKILEDPAMRKEYEDWKKSRKKEAA